MKRRKFLALTGLGLTSALALPNLKYLTASVKEASAGLILNEFRYLTLDINGIYQFIEDFFQNRPHIPLLELKLKAYYLMRLRAHESNIVADLAHSYLISTDFFLNGMDEGKMVKYVRFFNPYTIPCANPFSNIYYPSEEHKLM